VDGVKLAQTLVSFAFQSPTLNIVLQALLMEVLVVIFLLFMLDIVNLLAFPLLPQTGVIFLLVSWFLTVILVIARPTTTDLVTFLHQVHPLNVPLPELL